MEGIDEVVAFVVPPLITGLSLAVLHFSPWYKGRKCLPSVTAYIVGAAVFVGVPLTVMLISLLQEKHVPTLYWFGLIVANTVAGGISVALCVHCDGFKFKGVDTKIGFGDMGQHDEGDD
jgi:hypothetical protein